MKFFRWIDKFHWLWLGLAAPFMLFPSPIRSLAMLIVPGIWLLHFGLSGARAEGGGRSRRVNPEHRRRAILPLTPLNGSLLLMAIMVLVSTWATYDLAFSLPKISGMLLGLGVFFAVAREGSKSNGWWLSATLFLGMGIGIAGLGFVGTNWFSHKLQLLNPITSRIPLLLKGIEGAEAGFHPNEVAGALAWVLPLMLALSVSILSLRADDKVISSLTRWRLLRSARNDKWLRWTIRLLLWGATLFVTGVFVLTQSRGGYIGLAFAVIAMLFIALPKRWRLAMLALLILGLIVAGLTISPEKFIQMREWAVSSGVATESGISLYSLESRVEVWSRAVYGLQDFPFTGMGMNTFREVVHVLYPLFLIAPDVDIGHAHNEFIQAGLDLGIPGMIAFMGLYVGAFWMLFSAWSHRSRPTAIILGLGGGLTAHMLYGMVDAVSLGAKPGILFWMLLGLVAGLYQQVFSSDSVSDG